MEKYLNVVAAVAAVVIIACAFLLGFKSGSAAGEIKVANLEKAQAQASTKATQADLADLEAAQRRGDQLQRQLDLAEQTRLSQALEHSREIKRLTRGQPCLNAGAVRLLNRSGGIQPAVPEAAGRTDAEDAPAATDTDVAEWIDHAARQYATCRDRLGALIDFETAEEEEK
jgi:hypothetical protein